MAQRHAEPELTSQPCASQASVWPLTLMFVATGVALVVAVRLLQGVSVWEMLEHPSVLWRDLVRVHRSS